MTLTKYQRTAKHYVDLIYEENKGLHWLLSSMVLKLENIIRGIGKIEGEGATLNEEIFKKEVGKMLWFVSSIASHFGYDLEELAKITFTDLRKMEEGKIQ